MSNSVDPDETVSSGSMLFAKTYYYRLVNSVDTDQMPHFVVFEPSLHCLMKFLFGEGKGERDARH